MGKIAIKAALKNNNRNYNKIITDDYPKNYKISTAMVSVTTITVTQIKYGLPYCVTCPTMSTDPGSLMLNPGTRRRCYWDRRQSFGKTYLICIIAQVLQNYSDTPYWHFVSEGGSVSSSWKWKPVIKSPAHNPLLLQLPILLHSMTLTDIQGIKNWIRQVLLWLSSSFLINYTCYQYTAVCKYCTLCVQMLPISMRHYGNQVCLLFDCDVETAVSLLSPANQWYLFTFLGQINAV